MNNSQFHQRHAYFSAQYKHIHLSESTRDDAKETLRSSAYEPPFPRPLVGLQCSLGFSMLKRAAQRPRLQANLASRISHARALAVNPSRQLQYPEKIVPRPYLDSHEILRALLLLPLLQTNSVT
jgi:hypothetical protein